MDSLPTKRPAPGMMAAIAGFACALVAGIAIRDYATSWIVRLIVPVIAALVGILVTFKIITMRRSR